MSDREILGRAARLAARGAPFALATVVRREAPSSARPGWRALVEADGTMYGWLGGSCIEPTVRREALEVLRDGRPRYLVFAPEGAGDAGAAGTSDVLVFPMVCHSGGTVEIFVEPQLPSPALVLFGDSPVSRALAAMGPAAGYGVVVVGGGEAAPAFTALGPEVEAVDSAAEIESLRPGGGREAYALVATMGEWDEDAAREALDTGARYVGLVASPRRAAAIRSLLAGEGRREADLERLVSPAGLDLGAEEPGEIAVSILAELVELRRRRSADGSARRHGEAQMGPRLVSEEATRDTEESRRDIGESTRETGEEEAPADATPAARGVATDPVCGMAVDVARARHVYTHEGRVYYFCCPHCRERFAREPASFLG